MMNVFIVEDSKTLCGHLQSILSDIPGITMIGHAAAGEPDTIVGLIETLMPDAVIFDIDLKNMAVTGMLANIKKCCPRIKVMILADCTNAFDFNRCLYTVEDNFFDKASQFMKIRAALWQWVYAHRLDSGFDVLQLP